jgi:hypothetical protein
VSTRRVSESTRLVKLVKNVSLMRHKYVINGLMSYKRVINESTGHKRVITSLNSYHIYSFRIYVKFVGRVKIAKLNLNPFIKYIYISLPIKLCRYSFINYTFISY